MAALRKDFVTGTDRNLAGSRASMRDGSDSSLRPLPALCTVSDYAQRRVGGPINEPPPRFLLHIILATALAESSLLARPIGLMQCPQKRTLRGQCNDTFKLDCPPTQAEVADICTPAVCSEARQ